MDKVALIYTNHNSTTRSAYLLIGVVPQLHLDLTMNDLIATNGYTRDELTVEIVSIGDYDPDGLL